MMAAKNKKKSGDDLSKLDEIKEPTILIRPITRLGGLDNIHVALIALVVILVALLLLISYSKPYVVRNLTGNTTCAYVALNGSCVSPLHNASQIESIAESILASYASVNNSLAILPYYTDVSRINATYIPASRSWYVSMPSTNPLNNQTFYVATIINDTNTNRYTPLYQLPRPSILSQNRVVADGVIQLAGKSACISKSPLSTYWFLDPYSTGSIAALTRLFTIQNTFGNKINYSVKILFGNATYRIAAQVGLGNAEALGDYVYCASKDSAYEKFIYALNSSFDGDYESSNTLAFIAQGSGINTTNLDSCINSSANALEGQALIANYYNISYNPVIVTNCEYLSLPQTVDKAICYANSTLC
jgi:hypothetical protein